MTAKPDKAALLRGFAALLKKYLGPLVIRGLGAVAMLAMNVLVARQLPADQAGIFLWSVAVLMLASVVVRIGTDNSVLKLASIAFSEGKDDQLYRQQWFSLFLVGLVSLFVAINAVAVVWLVPFFSEGKRWVLSYMLAAIVPFSLLFLQTRFLIAARKSSLGIFFSTSAPFIGFILLIFLFPVENAATAAAAFLAVCLVSLSLALGVFPPGNRPGFPAKADRREMLLMSRHFWLAAVFSEMIIWVSQILAVIWCSPDELAWLALGQRIASIVSLPLIAVKSVISPQLASAMSQRDFGGLARGLRESSLIGLVIAAPLFVFIVAMPDVLIRMTVGEAYLPAVDLVLICAIGQLVNVSAGISGGMLAMTGNEKLLRNIIVGSGILCVLLSIILIPIYAAVGAALAFSITMVIQNVAMYLLSRQFIRTCMKESCHE
ncbi:MULTISPECIES: lipopolysaccharide biosynthesis protein [unclassified Alcanivorax]|nr:MULTISPECIES: MATE family efflux transporter [unclassified Alcanivorax]